MHLRIQDHDAAIDVDDRLDRFPNLASAIAES